MSELDLTEREILLKMHKVCCETLMLFADQLNNRFPLEGLAGLRNSILIATAAKSINTSNAIVSLCMERPYFEEMVVLVRTLIESIVNAAYLQFATDDEVNAYQHYDSIALSKSLRTAHSISPDAINILSEKLKEDFQAHTDSVKTMTGKSEQDFSWTRLDVVAKGDRIDKALGVNAFRVVCKVLFPTCHAYVHGNYRSLEAYMHPENGGIPKDQLKFYAEGTLHSMNVALFAFCITLNQLAVIRLDTQLSEIEQLVRLYSERVKAFASQQFASKGY